jgi:hypothetical protein
MFRALAGKKVYVTRSIWADFASSWDTPESEPKLFNVIVFLVQYNGDEQGKTEGKGPYICIL